MIIEITKRYIIGRNTLETIINDCKEFYDYMDDDFDFEDFLSEEIEHFCEDEKIISGDKESLKKIFEMELQLDELKEKYLS
jgi:hypothetical protein